VAHEHGTGGEVVILPLGINCAFKIRRKTVLQTVSPQKRFAKSFYKSANYDGLKIKSMEDKK